nr:unnamed protein product [Callosobruchus analis]
MLQKTAFNPITRRLKSIESTLHHQQQQQQQHSGGEEKKGKPPRESKADDDYDNGEIKSLLQSSLPKQLKNSINSGDYTALDSDDDDGGGGGGGGGGAKAHRARNLAEESLMEYLDQYDPLPRKYIREMYEDDERKETDHQYGVRLDTTVEKFKIGDSQLDIVGSDVYVKGKRYKGTQGLYELLFKKYPNKPLFNDEDVENYRRIVYKTNAHRRHHRRSGQIAGSKLEKYKRIIAPIASTVPTTSGGGGGGNGGKMMTMMEMTSNNHHKKQVTQVT